jgi:23S rRNA (cytidine1920-2'-O)/16S rRNA (cytidine1409-2'-O)-methyltransferase
LAALLAPEADIIALLKPQFEHKDYLTDSSFKGVVKGEQSHQRILEGVLSDLQGLLPDWYLVGLNFSPITGPKGNIEFLLHWVRGNPTGSPLNSQSLTPLIQDIITRSYAFHTHF